MMQYKLKVLSPLHIGCGETYNGLSYIVENNRLYYIPPDRFIDYLGERVNNFVKWIDDNTQKIDNLENEKQRVRDNKEKRKEIERKLRSIRNNFNLKEFLNNSIISKINLADISLYSVKLTDNFFYAADINASIKQMGQIYVPGSEIKGAIRTAIAYCTLMDDGEIYNQLKQQIESFFDDYKFLINCVKNENNLNKRLSEKETDLSMVPGQFKKYFNDKLSRIKDKILCNEMARIAENIEAKIFNAKTDTNTADAKYDLLKFLYIGDSKTRSPEDVLSVSRINLFRASRPFPIFNEIIIPDAEFILNDLKVEGVKSRQEKMNKIGFSAKQEKMVESLDAILDCCYRFSQDLIAEETIYFQRNGMSDIVSHLNTIANINSKDSPVLRIGKDEGFLSVTVALAVKKKDPDLYKNVLIHAIKGKSYESDLMPKTRKIVEYDGKKYTSGWVQIIKQDAATKTTASPISGKKNDTTVENKVDLSSLLDKYGKR